MSKYFDFSGRASRSEYWWFYLFWILLWAAASLAGLVTQTTLFEVLVTLALFIPSISAGARRLHDVGRSGWWQLLYLTVVGGLVVLFWLVSKGDSATNQFGEPPGDFPTPGSDRPSGIPTASTPPHRGSLPAAPLTGASPSTARPTSASPHPPPASVVMEPTTAAQPQAPNAAVDEDAIYAVVAAELETGNTDKGLWTRLFAECGGDDKQTKVLYIKHRAEKLIAAERAKLRNLEDQRAKEAAIAEDERIRRLREEFVRTLNGNQERLRKVLQLAEHHKSNPRLTVDEKGELLRYTGGDFKWLDGYGKCSATFLGKEWVFRSGKDFANWFMAEVVPFLLNIDQSNQ
jgi:uncharacterized membrane protein YhaH (DUF805 family)